MADATKSHAITVQFHLGAEHARFEAELTDSITALKHIALERLKVVVDAGVDYLLDFEGKPVENEAQTLGQLLGPHPKRHVEFHIRKRPKGGGSGQ